MTFKTLTDLDAWFRNEILKAMQLRGNYDVLLDIADRYNEYHKQLN